MPKRHHKQTKPSDPVRERRPAAVAITPAPWWMPLLLLLAGLMAHINSVKADFLFDCQQRIVNNPFIKNPPNIGSLLQEGQRALVNLSLWFNYLIDQTNPPGYHLFNITIHLLAALTLFGLLRRSLLGEKWRGTFGPSAANLAFCTALLWVVHPLTTTAVVYTIQRAESMMSLFMLLMLYSLVRGQDSPRSGLWNLLAILACAAGMASKPVMVVAPFIAFLFDITMLTGSFQESLRRRWYLYGLIAATWLVLLAMKVPQGVLNSQHEGVAAVGFSVKEITWWKYALTQPGVILHYLRLVFVPYPLILDYLWPEAQTTSAIVPPLLVLLVLLTTTVVALRRRPPLGFIAAAFFLILAPTSSFIPIKDLAVEHRMYLPLACVLTLVVLGGWAVLRYAVKHSRLSPSQAAHLTLGLLLVATLASGFTTVIRNTHYYSEERMWRLVVQQCPENYRAWCEIGRLIFTAGQKTGSLDKVREAMTYTEKALQYKPDYFLANQNMGNCWYTLQQFDKAVPYLEAAVRAKPSNPSILNSYGAVLLALKRYPEALEQFNRALKPYWYDAMIQANAGLAMYKNNLLTKAVYRFRVALEIDPNMPDVRSYLAEVLEQLQQTDEAIQEYQRVLQAIPNHQRARQRLNALLAAKDRASSVPTAPN